MNCTINDIPFQMVAFNHYSPVTEKPSVDLESLLHPTPAQLRGEIEYEQVLPIETDFEIEGDRDKLMSLHGQDVKICLYDKHAWWWPFPHQTWWKGHMVVHEMMEGMEEGNCRAKVALT